MEKEAALARVPAVVDRYEARLAALAKERSPQAWNEIYSRHYAQIYRYIQARVFDAESAEDLSSTVFLGAVKGIGAYQYRGQPLLAWLYAIARKSVSSHQRTMFRQRTLSLSAARELPGRMRGHPPSDQEPEGDEADPAEAVERLDLREAMTKLPPPQREVLLLKFFVGLETREISSVLSKGPGAVYSLQSRAMEGLRRHLS